MDSDLILVSFSYVFPSPSTQLSCLRFKSHHTRTHILSLPDANAHPCEAGTVSWISCPKKASSDCHITDILQIPAADLECWLGCILTDTTIKPRQNCHYKTARSLNSISALYRTHRHTRGCNSFPEIMRHTNSTDNLSFLHNLFPQIPGGTD